MEHLPGWSVERERLGEVVFWPEARRLFRKPPGHEEGARPDSGDGWGDRGQYLHETVPLFLRAVRLRCLPGDSARDRAVPELVLVQHLRNLFLVTRDPGAAVDLLRQETLQETP